LGVLVVPVVVRVLLVPSRSPSSCSPAAGPTCAPAWSAPALGSWIAPASATRAQPAAPLAIAVTCICRWVWQVMAGVVGVVVAGGGRWWLG